jgi:replicative DNA helicase
LASLVPTSSHLVHYAQIVQRKAMLRRLIHTAAEIHELGFDEAEDVDTVLDKAEQKLFAVTQQTLRQYFVPVKQLLAEAFDRLENRWESIRINGRRSGRRQIARHGLIRASLNELAITETELAAIAAAAIIGDRRSPVIG